MVGGANTIWFDRRAAKWGICSGRWEHDRSLGEIRRLRGRGLRSGVDGQLMMALFGGGG